MAEFVVPTSAKLWPIETSVVLISLWGKFCPQTSVVWTSPWREFGVETSVVRTFPWGAPVHTRSPSQRRVRGVKIHLFIGRRIKFRSGSLPVVRFSTWVTQTQYGDLSIGRFGHNGRPQRTSTVRRMIGMTLASLVSCRSMACFISTS